MCRSLWVTIAIMALLVVVTGPPGAGKSTVADLLVGRFGQGVLVPGDAFFAFVARGAIEPWLPAAHGQNEVVTRAAAAAAGRYAAGGYATVYDGVVGPWYLADFAAAAGLDCVHYAVLLPPAQRCAERVASRSGHGFTDQAATRHMHRQFAQAGISQRHLLPELPGGPDGTADEIISRIRSGMLRYP